MTVQRIHAVLASHLNEVKDEVFDGVEPKELEEALSAALELVQEQIDMLDEKNDPEINYDNPDSPYYLGGHATLEDIIDAQEWEAYDPYADDGFPDCEDDW